MDEEVISIAPEDMEIVDSSEYSAEIVEQFSDMPEVAKSLLKGAKVALKKIEKMIYKMIESKG